MENKKHKTPVVAAVSLGCPKNQVDTEMIIAEMINQGLQYGDDPEKADWLLINTCSFIRPAEAESIQVLMDAVKMKKRKSQRLLVVGCLVKKHGARKLRKLIPEIDLAIPPEELHSFKDAVSPWLPDKSAPEESNHPIPVLSTPGSAYLKITEGCSRRCAFCLIPQLRGPLHSKPIDAIVSEADRLVRQGVKELVIVAQDTASYGRDLGKSSNLNNLLDRLVRIKSLKWLRLMYINPDSIDNGLIRRLAGEPKLCNYLDMPVQHASPPVLKRMRRSGGDEQWLDLINRLRAAVPSICLRTTVLTGFPGETEKDHRQLLDFIKKARFDRLGAFAFSREKGTAADKMANQVHHATKQRRLKEIMELQAGISEEQLKRRVGRKINCLVEEQSGSRHVIARTPWDAPEIDGAIILEGHASPGSMVKAKILGSTTHDLNGVIL